MPPIHPGIVPQFLRSGLRPLRLGGRSLLPIVQGGMGIGVSAHRLAGHVAAEGGVGTLSSVDLRRHHADLMERTRDLGVGAAAKATIDAAPTSRPSTARSAAPARSPATAARWR